MPDQEIETLGKSPALVKGQKRLKHTRDCPFEKKYRGQSNRDLGYFLGTDQGWGDDDKQAKLNEEGKPTVTLNQEAPLFRLICGAKPDIEASYAAVEEGDVETQDILNAARKHVEALNFWEFHKDDWFKFGTMKMRSVCEILPDYNKDIMGEIKAAVQDGHTWYLDPDSKEKDRSDDRFRFRLRSLHPERAYNLFPHKKNALKNLVATVDEEEASEVTTQTDKVEDYRDLKVNYYDKGNNRLTIVYYWYKEYSKQTKIIDLNGIDLDGKPVIIKSSKNAQFVKNEIKKTGLEDRFVVVSVDNIQVKYMIFCHDIILEEGNNPWDRKDGKKTYLSDNFPQIIFEPERVHAGTRHELISVLKPLHDPQKYYNRLASAVLRIIGTASNSGIDYEEGAASPKWLQKLKKYGSKEGFNMQWAKGALTGNKFKPRTPAQVPQAHMMAAKEMADTVMNISGVESLRSTESLGKGASGVAIDLKQRQGGNTISWLYDSFRFFQHIFAVYIKDAIQALYDYEKVIRITGTKTRYVRINEQIFDYHGAVTEVLNDVTTGDYDVVVTDKEVMPTMRMERFKLFANLVEKGALQIPPPVMQKIVVELMDDPQLKQLIEEEMAAWTEEQQQMMGMQGQQGQLAA